MSELSEVTIGSGNPLDKQSFLPGTDDVFEKALVEAVPVSRFTSDVKRRAGRKNAAASKSAALDLSGYRLLDVARPPYNLEALAKVSETDPINYAAIRAKARSVTGLGYDLEVTDEVKLNLDEKQGDARTRANRRIAKAKIQVNKWIEKCCQDEEFLDVLHDVWVDVESTGNGYIEIGRTVKGAIGYIGHLPATTMRVRVAKDGFVQIVGQKMVFFRKFGDNTPDPINKDPRPNEVIHLKRYSPANQYYGVPDTIAASVAVLGNKLSQDYNLDFFENKAVPRYLIKAKGFNLSDTSQRKIAEFFANNVKGQNHRSVYVPIPAQTDDLKPDFVIEPIETDIQDSSFTNYFKINLQIILMAHAVPITKVTMPDSSTLSATKDFNHTYKEEVIKVYQDVLERKVTKIISEFTDIFEFSLNELDLTDEYERAKTDDIYIRSDVLVPNEVRVRRGMSELPDGNKTSTEKKVELAEVTKTDPTAQERAEENAQDNQTRERDNRRRRDSGVDNAGGARNPKGEGARVD